jgi:hypothetical protein
LFAFLERKIKALAENEINNCRPLALACWDTNFGLDATQKVLAIIHRFKLDFRRQQSDRALFQDI